MTLKETTRDMLGMIPPWMAMQKEDSNGALFLNVIGTQLEDLESLIETVLTSTIITGGELESDPEKVNILEVDYLYKIKPHEATIGVEELHIKTTILGIDHYPLRSETLYDFYKLGSEKYYLDIDTGTLYFKVNYESITVNGAEYSNKPLQIHSVWNPLDEIGLLFGCPRLVDSEETNEEYRRRLLDVFKNPGGSSNTGLINYISRSLNIDKEDVHVNSLDDDKYIGTLINNDGTMKSQLQEYIEISKSINGFGVNTYWETLDSGSKGLKYLPMIWDLGLNKWDNNQIQNGIGDTNDLEIVVPKQESSEQKFKYNLYGEGLLYPDKKIYPEHRFKYKVYATGKEYDDGYAPEPYKYTVTASDLILLAFDIVSSKEYKHKYRLDYKSVNVEPKGIEKYSGSAKNKPDKYITKDIKLVDGTYCTSPPRRYLQVLASMESDRKQLKTPTLKNVTIHYRAGASDKKVRVEIKDGIERVSPDEHIVGFETNNWDEASPLFKIKNDTEDSFNVITHENDTLTLGHGDYHKVYDSRGDWDDGMSNSETRNVLVTTNGTLTLNNMK